MISIHHKHALCYYSLENQDSKTKVILHEEIIAVGRYDGVDLCHII